MFRSMFRRVFGRFCFVGLVLFLTLMLISQTRGIPTNIANGHLSDSQFVYLPIISKPLGVPTSDPILDETTFIETFDGSPSSPQSFADDNWDVTVHLRDDDVLYNMIPMNGHHGPNCEAPPATHQITSYNDTVYKCRDHMMTAIYGVSQYGGYGLIYLTPDRTIDASESFSIHFDMSTFRANNARDWVDVWITPYNDNLQLAIHEFEPDLQGPPREAVQFRLDVSNRLEMYYHKNGVATKYDVDRWTEYDSILTPSKKTRTTFVVAVYDGILYVGLPDHGVWWYERTVPSFMRGSRWQKSVVQLGHHSYTPDKMCESSDNPNECGPNTYHWDNIALWPSTPFTMIHGTPRQITASSSNKTFTLDAPAPANAKLRFAGIGDRIEVSFDSGSSWQDAVLQSAPSGQARHFFRSHWMDIPEGTTTVRFRGEDWMFFSVPGGEWAARDITVWSP